ncbi:MAG: NAD(P)/FAD-dependent oxidoreductase [Cyclobacteriaceae bacterium]
MEKLAILGTGIAGMGCAHFLQHHYDLTLFEKNDYIGGHTHTVKVKEGEREVPIDTGFIVCNPINYPNLWQLFEELEVPLKPANMSFSVQHQPSNLEYSGSGLNGLFGQRRNILNPRFIRMLKEVERFNKDCTVVLEGGKYTDLSVKDFVSHFKYSPDFSDQYLLPLSSALWSTPPELSLQFPMVSLVKFLNNHGMLGLNTHFQWYTVEQGSWTYRDRLIAPFRDRIQVNKGVHQVKRLAGQVEVSTTDGEKQLFDRVILACHADQALDVLEDPKEEEINLLGQFLYQTNQALLHNDSSVMPKRKRLWSSWNYRLEELNGQLKASTHYYMNSLQGLSDQVDYFLSINDPGQVDPDSAIKQITYEHPIFTVGAFKAQEALEQLNDESSVLFCGSYFGNGFHEDAFVSALNLCEKLTRREVGVE